MPWGWAGGQNTENPHTLVSLSSVFFFVFFVKCILILLARCDSGKLRCTETALIDPCHILGSVHARVLKFHVWIPRGKTADTYFFLVRVMSLSGFMPL